MVISASSLFRYSEGFEQDEGPLGEADQTGLEEISLSYRAAELRSARLDLGKPDMYSTMMSSRIDKTPNFTPPASFDASEPVQTGNILPDDFNSSNDVSRVEEVEETAVQNRFTPRSPSPQRVRSPIRLAPPLVAELQPAERSPPRSPARSPSRRPLERAPSPLFVAQPEVLEPIFPDSDFSDPDFEQEGEEQGEREEQGLRIEADRIQVRSRQTRQAHVPSNSYELRRPQDQQFSLLLDEIPEQHYKVDSPKDSFQFDGIADEEQDELVDEMVVGKLASAKDREYRELDSGSSSDSDSDSDKDSAFEHDPDNELELDLDLTHVDVDEPRGTRNRVPTLATWRGERINYIYDQETGTRTVESVHLVEEEPEQRPVKKHRRTQPVSIDSVRADEVAASLFDEEKQEYSEQVFARALEGSRPLHEIEDNTGVYMSLITSASAPVVVALLKFQRYGIIERRNSGQLWYTFIVWTGKLVVQVQDKELVLQREGTVTVPAGNYYMMENVGTTECKLLMVQASSQQEVQEASKSIDVSTTQLSDL